MKTTLFWERGSGSVNMGSESFSLATFHETETTLHDYEWMNDLEMGWFPCTVCKRVFNEWESLHAQLAMKHLLGGWSEKYKKFPCAMCAKRFT